jgi:NADPH:quinone reductase-like Zn-dependent oxidoreductase
MRAFTLDGFDAQPALRDDIPEPRAGDAELLVRVRASSVNPVDLFNLMADPTPPNLTRLAELLDSGALRIPIQRSYSLEQAAEALQALPNTHTQGKLGLTIE